MSIIYDTFTVSTIAGERSYTHRAYRHTKACRQIRNDIDAQREAFYSLYPKACRTCGAHSIVGDVYDSETGGHDPIECDECLESEACPLCGEHDTGVVESGFEKCDSCGWGFFTGPYAPLPYECWGCNDPVECL